MQPSYITLAVCFTGFPQNASFSVYEWCRWCEHVPPRMQFEVQRLLPLGPAAQWPMSILQSYDFCPFHHRGHFSAAVHGPGDTKIQKTKIFKQTEICVLYHTYHANFQKYYNSHTTSPKTNSLNPFFLISCFYCSFRVGLCLVLTWRRVKVF